MNACERPDQGELSEIAEVQLRKWAAALSRISQRIHLPQEPLHKADSSVRCDFGGIRHDYDSVVAKSLAKRFGWDCLDSGLLNYVVEHYDWRNIALDYVNEESASWFQQTFGNCLQVRPPSKSEYVTRCARIFLLASHQASHIFAGGGAQFFLPRERGLCVRLVDLKQQRVTAVVERRHCSQKVAARFVDDGDESEAHFIKRQFRQNVADPHLYDVTINLERTSIDAALDLILGDYMLRFEPTRVWCAFRPEDNRRSHRM